MDSKDYEKILDSIPATGVCVIREDNHEILYVNSWIREMAPDVVTGKVCEL